MRAKLDRKGQIRCSMDPQRAQDLSDGDVECTMCGEFCAIRIMREFKQFYISPDGKTQYRE
jgi:thiamine biosynthesis protein ThiC